MVLGRDCVRGRCVRGWWYSCLPSWGDAREEAPDGVSPVEGACTRRPVAPGESPFAGTFHACGDTAVVGGQGGGCGDGGGGRGHPARPGTFHSSRGRLTRAGTFSSGRGHPARPGTGLLSPTASNAPGRGGAHPAARNVPVSREGGVREGGRQTLSRAFPAAPDRISVGLRETCPARWGGARQEGASAVSRPGPRRPPSWPPPAPGPGGRHP